MKNFIKKTSTLIIAVAIVAMCGAASGCKSSSKSNSRSGGETMYERHQSNKGAKIKSNIRVKGTKKKNGHTTRSY